MNKGIVKQIMMLGIFVALSGCASTGAPFAANSEGKPILSAAEAQSMIRVSVRTLPPPAYPETTVAAND